MAAERHYSGGRFEALASYCRAVRAGSHIFVSGCAAIDDEGTALFPGDTRRQTHASLEVALAAVEALGGSREDVVRSRLLLGPTATWRDAVQAHGEVLRGVDPANTTYFVHGFIPAGVLVEVELDAVVG